MALTSVSSPYLKWNSDKRFFEILDSTDRKIISFLFNSIMPTCYFYRQQLLPTYPWSEKGFSYFKPFFLQKIDRQFQQHITECPVEEYKQTFISFYHDLRQKICDLTINSVVSKEIALFVLQTTTADCFLNLFSKPPLNMPLAHFRDFLQPKDIDVMEKGQCYHYALYLTEEYKAMRSMIPVKSAYNITFLLYPGYFLEQLGYSKTDKPLKGDLVLYLGDPKLHNNTRFKHLAVMTEKGTVKSCWGHFSCEFEHSIFQVPDIYGSEVTFFHKTRHETCDLDKIVQSTNLTSNLILQFNTQIIPSPLTSCGALLFLLDKLKSACKRSHQGSEQWPWKIIKENLCTTFSTKPPMDHIELCLEFKLWMQEILPQYFTLS